jgi:hypothetical protein
MFKTINYVIYDHVSEVGSEEALVKLSRNVYLYIEMGDSV